MLTEICAFLCLVAASASDVKEHKVCDIIWWIFCIFWLEGVLAGAHAFTQSFAFEMLFVIFVQEKIMKRCYGPADSHAFSCCALMLGISGDCLMMHTVHMGLSLFLLTFHQIIRRNIGRNLKLKVPVPYIPYITVSYMVIRLLALAAVFYC